MTDGEYGYCQLTFIRNKRLKNQNIESLIAEAKCHCKMSIILGYKPGSATSWPCDFVDISENLEVHIFNLIE